MTEQGRVHRRKRAPCWSYTAGAKGHTVTVYERVPGGPLQARCFDATMRDGRGGYRREALGHRDQGKAETYARSEDLLTFKSLDLSLTLSAIYEGAMPK